MQALNVDLLNLGNEAVASPNLFGLNTKQEQSTGRNDRELLNFSAPDSSNTCVSDLLQGLIPSSDKESSNTTAFHSESNTSSSNAFFSLDPFAPLGESNLAPKTPSKNLTSSNSFSNFATSQQSQPINDSLISDWDHASIFKQTSSGSSLPLHTPGISRNSSTPNFEKLMDPLADLGNFTGQGLGNGTPSSWNFPTIKPNPPINIGN